MYLYELYVLKGIVHVNMVSTLELSVSIFKEGLNQMFGVSLKHFSFKSSLECLVSAYF